MEKPSLHADWEENMYIFMRHIKQQTTESEKQESESIFFSVYVKLKIAKISFPLQGHRHGRLQNTARD